MQVVLVHVHYILVSWLPRQRPLTNWKTISSAPKTLMYGEKIAKIGPVLIRLNTLVFCRVVPEAHK